MRQNKTKYIMENPKLGIITNMKQNNYIFKKNQNEALQIKKNTKLIMNNYEEALKNKVMQKKNKFIMRNHTKWCKLNLLGKTKVRYYKLNLI